jgi:Ca2+-binding RTX toxin-like protein
MRRLLALAAVACLSVVFAGGSGMPVSAGGTTCTIRGTSGPDNLVGTPERDVICGKGGNDNLEGRGGRDLLLGGDGNDTLDGDYGNDVMRGGAGGDKFVDFHGQDKLYGEKGPDQCMNGRDGGGNDYLHGGPGEDGYNTDPGDTRVDFEYIVDPEFCDGWDGHGQLPE